MHDMRIDIVHFDGPKRSDADVQCHFVNCRLPLGDIPQEAFGKVQPRGRGCNTRLVFFSFAGKHRLIIHQVSVDHPPVANVWGDGNSTESLEPLRR